MEVGLPSTIEDTRLVISREEFSELLGISIGTVDRMRARGELRAVRVGRCIRIPLTEVERLLSNRDPLAPEASAPL